MAVTAFDLKQRFDAFAGLSDEAVAARIDDAAGHVDETWREADRDKAVMLLACHYLVVEDALHEGDKTVETRVITSKKLGNASETYATPQPSPAMDTLQESIYGRRFCILLRQNFTGPRII